MPSWRVLWPEWLRTFTVKIFLGSWRENSLVKGNWTVGFTSVNIQTENEVPPMSECVEHPTGTVEDQAEHDHGTENRNKLKSDVNNLFSPSHLQLVMFLFLSLLTHLQQSVIYEWWCLETLLLLLSLLASNLNFLVIVVTVKSTLILIFLGDSL